MVIPIDPRKTEDYVFSQERHVGKGKSCPCGADRCSAEPDTPIPGASVFVIGPPTESQRAAILDAAAAYMAPDDHGNRPVQIRTGSLRKMRVRYGLRGVKNFAGWETERDPVSDVPVPTGDFLSTIPDPVLLELDIAISALTDISEEMVGKSAPQSEQGGAATSEAPAGPAAT